MADELRQGWVRPAGRCGGSGAALLAAVLALWGLAAGAETFAQDWIASIETPLAVVHVGNNPSDLAAFEAWLGRPADGVQLFTGDRDWADWAGSVGWMANRWAGVDRLKFWSVPLIPRGATLAEAAAGAYDARYELAARTLVEATPEGPILLRTGWEFNGNWFPWAAQGKEADYAAAFRRFADIARATSDRFVIEWAPNIGDKGMNPEDAYPGDAAVDLIGLDFYYNPDYYPADPDRAWRRMVTEPYGLQWHQEFAAARDKPAAYSEWGVTTATAAPYVEQARDWFATHGVVYQSYWNSDAAFRGRLSEGRIPGPAAAYRAAFGTEREATE